MVFIGATAFCRRSVSRRLLLLVLGWTAVVCQLNIASFSRSDLVCLSPSVGRNAGKDEECEMDEPIPVLAESQTTSIDKLEIISEKVYLQNQGQEHIRRDFHLSQGVDERIALVSPEVERVARNDAIELE